MARGGPAECARPSTKISPKSVSALICIISASLHIAQPQGLAEFNRSAHSAGPGRGTWEMDWGTQRRDEAAWIIG